MASPISQTSLCLAGRIPVTEVPTEPSDLEYQGSNPEYIIFKADGSSISEAEYLEQAYPILRLQFPRTSYVESALSDEEIAQLEEDEIGFISTKLSEKGFATLVIPKTLYDLFYHSHRAQYIRDLMQELQTSEDIQTGKKVKEAYNLFNWRINTLWSKLVDQTTIDQAVENAYQSKYQLKKLDFKINQYITTHLHSSLTKNKCSKITWKTVQESFKFLSEAFTSHSSKALRNQFYALIPKYEGGNQYFENELDSLLDVSGTAIHRGILPCSTVLEKTLWDEYTQPANIYTVYRGGSLERDGILTSSDKWHSLSFGQSWFSSSEVDYSGAGATPINYVWSDSDPWGVHIDTRSYRIERATHTAPVIMGPAQRCARYRIKGEHTHGRSCVLSPNTTGLQGQGAKAAYLLLNSDVFPDTKSYTTIMEDYFLTHAQSYPKEKATS
jgi:hypothetical protein